MLTITKDVIQGSPDQDGINPTADVFLFGQEVNPVTFAICKADLFIKSEDGKDAENILYGSTLAHDRHAAQAFDCMIANPPYGKELEAGPGGCGARGRAGQGVRDLSGPRPGPTRRGLLRRGSRLRRRS